MKKFQVRKGFKSTQFLLYWKSIAEIIIYLGAVWNTFLCPNCLHYITQEKICQHLFHTFLQKSTKFHP